MDLKSLLASAYGVTLVVSSEIMKAAMAAENEEREKRALKGVQGLIGKGQEELRRNVALLRNLRKQEREQAETVKRIDRAFQFFLTSGNPLPMLKATNNHSGIVDFCRNAGIEVPKLDSEAYKVPDDFKVVVENEA